MIQTTFVWNYEQQANVDSTGGEAKLEGKYQRESIFRASSRYCVTAVQALLFRGMEPS